MGSIDRALSTKAEYECHAFGKFESLRFQVRHTPKSVVVEDREIYPTKPNGGREWFINTTSPLNDNNFFLSGGTEKTNSSLANATSANGQIIKQLDGSYQVYGVRKAGKYDFSVRMNVNTSDNAQWWKNVEMTGYAKVISTTSSDAALDWYARGRLHISSSPCEGVAYHSGLRADGSVFCQKEIWHTGGTQALGVILLLPIHSLEDGLVLRRSCLT